MRWPRFAGVRRFLSMSLAVFLTWSLLLWLFLPYDSPILLLVRFAGRRLVLLLQLPFTNGESWLLAPPEFPVDLHQDVVLIIKTGYGTQARLHEQLDALRVPGGPDLSQNLLVIADFSSRFKHRGQDILIHDVVASAAESDALAGVSDSDRLLKYKNMTAAISAGDYDGAKAIGKAAGWELDAMKFLPGLELAYRTIPDKKWYVMLDDDTYLLQPSLRMVLGHLDPSLPVYTGNAVGDYSGRFAHGGSSFVVSRAAMGRLFRQNPHLVPAAYLDSVTEIWGDKLVATTFMKMGVYLDERYSHMFNGERPWITRIRADRFCSPVVSFHGLAEPWQMREVGERFRSVGHAVLWSELWEIYGQPDLEAFARNPVRLGRDHVGRSAEVAEAAGNVDSVDKCLDACNTIHESCLAWTWDDEAKTCYVSPWMIIGEQRAEAYSGVNVARFSKLLSRCSQQKG